MRQYEIVMALSAQLPDPCRQNLAVAHVNNVLRQYPLLSRIPNVGMAAPAGAGKGTVATAICDEVGAETVITHSYSDAVFSVYSREMHPVAYHERRKYGKTVSQWVPRRAAREPFVFNDELLKITAEEITGKTQLVLWEGQRMFVDPYYHALFPQSLLTFITADHAVRKQRLMDRDKMTEDEALTRMCDPVERMLEHTFRPLISCGAVDLTIDNSDDDPHRATEIARQILDRAFDQSLCTA